MQITESKVIIITGASRGIGAATASLLASKGHRIVVNYASNSVQAEQVVKDIQQAGGIATAYQADISQSAQVIALFEAAEQAFGKVDILINNAGIMKLQPIAELDDSILEQVIDINIKGTFYCLREAARRLSDGGKIINLSSSVIAMKLEGYGIYTASKAAVEAFTAILAKELRGRNITVNNLAPGPTATELFFDGKSEELVERLSKASPLERLGDPEDIAAVIDFMVSDASNWINAQTIRVNGGIV